MIKTAAVLRAHTDEELRAYGHSLYEYTDQYNAAMMRVNAENHSVKIKERDSNYGVLFSMWDRFLGTFTWGVDQETITIGIGSHRKFNQLGFWHLMKMPFTKQSL